MDRRFDSLALLVLRSELELDYSFYVTQLFVTCEDMKSYVFKFLNGFLVFLKNVCHAIRFASNICFYFQIFAFCSSWCLIQLMLIIWAFVILLLEGFFFDIVQVPAMYMVCNLIVSDFFISNIRLTILI